METDMRDVDLHLLVILILCHELASPSRVDSIFILSEFFSDFKKSFFDFLLNIWFQLLLHIVHLQLLPLEALQRMLAFSPVRGEIFGRFHSGLS